MEASPLENDGAARRPGRYQTEPLPPPDAPPGVDGSPGSSVLPPPGPVPESYAELRPPRRLRLVQLAPIVVLSLLGSLMFAFPLAFAFDEAGAVVAMLGLLIGCSAAGWGLVAARRAGHTWPGLPPRGSGGRPDWRMLALYLFILVVFGLLAVWRIAGLR